MINTLIVNPVKYMVNDNSEIFNFLFENISTLKKTNEIASLQFEN